MFKHFDILNNLPDGVVKMRKSTNAGFELDDNYSNAAPSLENGRNRMSLDGHRKGEHHENHYSFECAAYGIEEKDVND